MKKEWILLAVSSIGALLLGLGVIRLVAPQLLGAPASLKLVSVDEKVPPFFEGVFRSADYASSEFLLDDPYTYQRAKPLFTDYGGMGPHDILGFRNRRIPNAADIVFIGDSQTYGNNAALEENFPSQVARLLPDRQAVPYAMAVGGWGAVQYLDMFTKALRFQPRVVVVAFYTGNDPIDSFNMAYTIDKWKALIPDPSLSPDDLPEVAFPAPESSIWRVDFSDGTHAEFTPTLRLASNLDLPAIRAGYRIMANIARVLGEVSAPHPVKLVFTIVPTKELVYASKVARDGLSPPPDYTRLTERERANIAWLATQIRAVPGVGYVDLLAPLQQAALSPAALYPDSANGHPLAAGYQVIATAIAGAIETDLRPHPTGLKALFRDADSYSLVVVNDQGVFPFPSTELVAANGWEPGDVASIEPRDIANLPMHRPVAGVDPDRYGPASIR